MLIAKQVKNIMVNLEGWNNPHFVVVLILCIDINPFLAYNDIYKVR